MDLSQLVQQIVNLTNRLNAITSQAKKIWELPWQNILNPASQIHVSNDGESQRITIQQILDAALSYRQNQLISANITVDENNVTVDSGAVWIINNINHETVSNTIINVPYAETGYTRNDILVGNESNIIYRIAGPETEGVSPTPNVPINTVLITTINVTDSSIGYVPPVIGADFVEKLESSERIINSVSNIGIQWDLPQYSSLRFVGSMSILNGVTLTQAYQVYSGKKLTIKNFQTIDLLLKHLHSGGDINTKFFFPSETDFILKPGYVIEFSYSMVSDRFEFIGVDIDKSSYYTKTEIDSKLSSVLVYKGSVEDYASLPSTGLTVGDVYNLSDTGHNYAWTGTFWDDLGPAVNISGKEDTSNKTDIITGNETSSSFYASIKGIVDWLTATKIKSILGITTLSGSNTGDETTASLKTKIDDEIAYACSDEVSNLVVGNVIQFRVPFAMILSEVRISVNDAPTTSSLIVDVKESGVSIFSTLLSIDATELTSVTAAVPVVISDVNLADDALIVVSITQIGSGNSGKGLKILFKGKKA